MCVLVLHAHEDCQRKLLNFLNSSQVNYNRQLRGYNKPLYSINPVVLYINLANFNGTLFNIYRY